MSMRALALLLICTSLCGSGLASAQQQQLAASAPASLSAPFQTVYITDFGALDQGGNGLLLSRLRAGARARKAQQSAHALTQALVDTLRAAGWQTVYLAPGAALPRTGWIMRGVLYVTDSQGHLLAMLSDQIGTSAPNTEVTISLSDAALDPAAPFAVLGRTDTLRGLGSNVSFNPYVVAAKFVLHNAESAASVHTMSEEILTELQTQLSTLEQQDTALQSH